MSILSHFVTFALSQTKDHRQWKIVMVGKNKAGEKRQQEISVTDEHKNKMCAQSPFLKMMFKQFDDAGEKLRRFCFPIFQSQR